MPVLMLEVVKESEELLLISAPVDVFQVENSAYMLQHGKRVIRHLSDFRYAGIR